MSKLEEDIPLCWRVFFHWREGNSGSLSFWVT